MTFCTLTGNADMHLKNWSLIYPDKRMPALSPAYDLVSTIPYVEDEKAALKFARTKRFDGYTLDELSCLAGKAGLPETPVLNTAKQTVERFHEVWEKEKNNLPQRRQVTERIDAHLKTLRITRASDATDCNGRLPDGTISSIGDLHRQHLKRNRHQQEDRCNDRIRIASAGQ